jgi:hypothetical protein
VKTTYIVLFAMLAALLIAPEPALAYVGPGSGITAIGAALALIGGIFFAILGFLWYPIKRLLRAIRGTKVKDSEAVDHQSH